MNSKERLIDKVNKEFDDYKKECMNYTMADFFSQEQYRYALLLEVKDLTENLIEYEMLFDDNLINELLAKENTLYYLYDIYIKIDNDYEQLCLQFIDKLSWLTPINN